MPSPEIENIEAKLRAAESSAAPSAEELQSGNKGWRRGGLQWPAERQLAFNRATVDVLRALLETAQQQQARIEQLQQQLAAAVSLNDELQTRMDQSDAASRTEVQEQIRQVIADQQQQLGQLANEQRQQVEQLTEAITNEQRERIQHVLDEQRVCLRQLALESSEEDVLADRARRATELRLEELAKRVDQLGANQTA
jgi:hypothetical protein